jgi:hypothetical protein
MSFLPESELRPRGIAMAARYRINKEASKLFSAGESAILSPQAGCEKVFALVVKWSGLFYDMRDNSLVEHTR